ncbi:hypothetical protein SLEP1_g43622 [Rubroshorea leprosula]|uniref:Uncharacterized protein n=1 Tax=Rubroshorea leprosula TaxID=152421 RepID=A0AAV5LDP7_9ROSI|nr:hypothetical protein SLEP1_g43622 [Rubroshorea leprosula]
MISEKFYNLIFRFSDCDMISFKPCAFVRPSHECTVSVVSRIWDLGRDISTPEDDNHFKQNMAALFISLKP